MPRLDGKVALITGAAVGMGAAHAELFVEQGAKVIVSDVNAADGKHLVDRLGPTARFVELDVTQRESWELALDAGESAFGPISVLVNNAGVAGPVASTIEVTDAEYQQTVDVDQYGVYLGMSTIIPRMVVGGGGSIVNISSVAGFRHVPGSPNVAYTGAKFAVRGMTKVAAIEYAQHGIRVNSVHPGGVLTPLLAATFDTATQAAIAAAVPMRRLADPAEISRAVCFLASDDASYITGTELVVDGGMLAQ